MTPGGDTKKFQMCVCEGRGEEKRIAFFLILKTQNPKTSADRGISLLTSGQRRKRANVPLFGHSLNSTLNIKYKVTIQSSLLKNFLLITHTQTKRLP